MDEMSKTAQGTLALIEDFLKPVREAAEKEAAAVSFKDTAAATLPNQEKQTADEGKINQTDLGVEQNQDAKDGGGTTDTTPENKDSDADKVPDDQGPQTLDSDQPVRGKGNIGPIREQEITQEQKTARFERLANGLLKTAAEYAAGTSQVKLPAAKPAEKPKAEAAPVVEAEKTAEDQLVEKCAEASLEAAHEYFEAHLFGMLKRAQDEAELANADLGKLGISKEKLAQLGGISGLLDKTAQADPSAVMPEELLGALPGAGAETVPAEAAALPGVLPGAGEDAGMGALPGAEAGVEAGGDVSEEELGALTDALAEAGVSPEDIDQATQDIMDLFQAGVSPEEAAQAIGELVEENIGGEPGAAEGVPAEAAAEAPPVEEEPPAEAPVEEKTASEKEARDRIDMIKNHLRAARTN